ncbi:hypothetical protein BB558_005158 [Smittium angustum]|uniref:MULE transposase domain-containing protein n=1 Tax=Smittium angustum TaxID=133377 RepID=A0A2U1J190_SMIAN|nr:hypothetical protein BB558_005158 [Smittium angustum]
MLNRHTKTSSISKIYLKTRFSESIKSICSRDYSDSINSDSLSDSDYPNTLENSDNPSDSDGSNSSEDSCNLKFSEGIFLVACFKNGINTIQILAGAVVETENHENWAWFINFIWSKLKQKPAFIISDRDKGLISAVLLLEWSIAISNRMRSLELAEKNWRKKRTLLMSNIPRFGILTSNNVESIKNALKDFTNEPILDLLFSIKKYVLMSRKDKYEKAIGWKYQITDFTKKALFKKVDDLEYLSFISTSSVDYIVTSKYSEALSVDNRVVLLFPCLAHQNFLVRYKEKSKSIPLTLKSDLTIKECFKPTISNRRGRPKKNIIESQQASQDLERVVRKQKT